MKCRFALLAILSSLFPPIQAQLSLNYNRLRPGDNLVKYQVEYKTPGKSGQNILWDFSKQKIINENYQLSYCEPSRDGDSCYVMGNDRFLLRNSRDGDLVIGKEHYTRYFYRYSGDSLLLLGHESPTVTLRYHTPCVMAVYPFLVGSLISNHYTATGLYCGLERVATNGDVTTMVDATGRMVLPSGDTLSPVVRTRTVQTIVDELDSTSNCKVLETYRWYTKGYRYPIFETIEHYNRKDSLVYFKTAFFYPPQDHYYISNDPENTGILDELWSQKNTGGDKSVSDSEDKTSTKTVSIAGLLTCRLYPNPVATDLNIAYDVCMKANVSFSLHSIDGFPIKQIPSKVHEPGSYSLTINCSGLFPRNYILRVTANDKIANGVILKK